MVRIVAFVRPHLLESVQTAVGALGVTGMTVADVRGRGVSPEATFWQGSEPGVLALPIVARIETVVTEELRDETVDAIVAAARTGEHGDGKIFVEPVLDAVRIRTGERGDPAA